MYQTKHKEANQVIDASFSVEKEYNYIKEVIDIDAYKHLIESDFASQETQTFVSNILHWLETGHIGLQALDMVWCVSQRIQDLHVSNVILP